MVGRTISRYKIVERLGAGGMGEVWKGEDTTLGRAVALKFLAPHLLGDDEAKQRFLREAKAAAAITHPNICRVYEVDEEDGKTFLAMEYLEGEPLEDRIGEGPMSLKDVLDIGRQVAEGLEAAHEKGIVHRDIKPANVMADAKGRATILDFGLARLTEASKLTRADQTVGTAAYMSPEQIEGGEVDQRTDIWALGCVLYEMVAGVRPFKGQYEQALAYEICNQELEPLTAVRAGVPMDLEFIVGKCLAKEADDRYGDCGEVAKDLRTLGDKLKSGRSTVTRFSQAARETLVASSARSTGVAASGRAEPDPTAVAVSRGLARLVLTALAFSILAALSVSFLHFSERPPERRVRRFSITPPGLLGGVISPDGNSIAYLADSGEAALWVRRLDDENPRKLAAPADINVVPCLAWSPDSSSIAFAQGGELRRVSLSGLASVTLCKLPISGRSDCLGAAWSPDGDTLVFSSGTKPYVVSAGGGEPRILFETGGPDSPPDFWAPQFLPSDGGSEALLFDAGSGREATMWVADLRADEQRILGPGNAPWYSDTGHLLHGPANANEPGLWATPFSSQTLTATGAAFRVDQTGFLPSVARDGALVYTQTPSRTGLDRLVWRDRTGAPLGAVGQPQPQMTRPAVSPDGRLVAVASAEGDAVDIWIHDAVRGTKTRLTFGNGSYIAPTWSPSGSEIAYHANLEEDAAGGPRFVIASRSSDATGDAAVLVDAEGGGVFDPVWFRDGRRLAYSLQVQGRGDVWYATREEGGGFERKSFLSSPADEGLPTPSPDGRLLAYISDESGRREIYLRRFPDGSDKRQVSVDGGTQPVWRPDGGELFYVEGATLMAVTVSTAGGLTLGLPQALFESEDLRSTTRHPEYDVSPDGEQFLTIEPDEDQEGGGSVIRVVENWYEPFRQN